MNEQEKMVVSEEPNGKPKSKVGIIAIILVIIALVGISGFLYYRLVMLKNPLKVLIHDTLSYAEKNIKEPKSGVGSFSFKVSGNSSDSSNNEIFSMISKIGISGQYGVDYTNKLINFDIDTTYDNKKLVNVNLYSENGTGYIDLEGLFDKYISVPIENYNETFDSNDNAENYKTILRSVSQVLDESLKEEYFKKEKVSLDGKKVVKTTLHLDKKNYDTLKKDILNRLLNDNKFLESVASVSGKSTKEIRDAINELKDKEDEFEGLDLSVYMSGSNWVQIELVESSDKILIKNEGSKKNISLFENDKLLFEMIIESKVTDNKGNFIIHFSDKEDDFNITINMDFSFDEGKAVEKKDISNSVTMDSISEEELQGIYTKVLQNEGIVTLIQEISKISNN